MSINCVRKGKYLVVKDTIVAVHETESVILGIVVYLDNEWVLVVPENPTVDMVLLSKEFDYDLPIYTDKNQLLSDMDTILNEMNELQTKFDKVLDEMNGFQNKFNEIQSKIKLVQNKM